MNAEEILLKLANLGVLDIDLVSDSKEVAEAKTEAQNLLREGA